jgi:hypothetical protein
LNPVANPRKYDGVGPFNVSTTSPGRNIALVAVTKELADGGG